MDYRIIRIGLRDFSGDDLKLAEEKLNTEINFIETRGELQALTRYLENYAKMAQIMESYRELLREDRERIYNVAKTFQEMEGKIYS